MKPITSKPIRLRAAAASLGVLLLLSEACEKFTADDASGGAGGSAGALQAHGSAGSSGALGPSAGAADDAGSGGNAEAAGAGAGAPSGGTGEGGGAMAGAANAGSGGRVSECPCAAPTPTCEAGKCVVRGPSMIKVTSPKTFYIDSTEVTSAQYAVFTKFKAATPAGQTPECSWNTSFDPPFVQGLPAALPNHPVTNIDFCDAQAYCAWADKRLCGKIDGGPVALVELANPSTSQWFAACAGPMSQLYPYGGSYQAGACNDVNGAQKLLEVGTEPKCQGYYPGLFDMLGNAQEWVDACDAKVGAHDGCERIGGSYLSSASTLCSSSGQAERDEYAPQVGFRCCSK